MDQNREVEVPSLEEISSERKRIRRGEYYRKAMKGTVSVLIVVAAVAVLIATLFLPILQISGDSMSPTYQNGEIVVLFKSGDFERGDVIGFYYQGKILLKRVIGVPGDTLPSPSMTTGLNQSTLPLVTLTRDGWTMKRLSVVNICLGTLNLVLRWK